MTSCLLLLVVLFLNGLGFGDSPLVILSLCSLVLSFVISSLLVFVCFVVFFCFFLSLYSLFCLMFFHEVASWIYIFLTYQKKRLMVVEMTTWCQPNSVVSLKIKAGLAVSLFLFYLKYNIIVLFWLLRSWMAKLH